MSYIIRVIGYDSYWTANTEPGKCWSNNIDESQRFETKEEAEVIVNNGMNMQVVEYDFAVSDIQNAPPDWDAIDQKFAEAEERKNQEVTTLDDFETITDDIHDVDVEVM
jgi:hypothetical protein